MDPLSITASCIAITGALAASGKTLRKAIALRHASADLQDLANEIESLRGIVTIVQASLLHIHGSQLYADHGEVVAELLESTRRPVVELRALIELRATRPPEGDVPRVSKVEWLRSGPEIERLRRRIGEARSNLSIAIGALNLQLGGRFVRQHALQVQSFSVVSQGVQKLVQDSASEVSPGRTAGLTPTTQQLATSVLPDRQNILLQEAAPSPAITPGVEIKAAAGLRITTSVNLRACPAFCRCRCHTTSRVQTPRFLRKVLGQLMLTYTGVLRTTACDYAPCRKSANKSRFT